MSYLCTTKSVQHFNMAVSFSAILLINHEASHTIMTLSATKEIEFQIILSISTTNM